ncbi:MAG: DNA polymerase I [Parcubacteria group bacterium]|nr:DNA polymerase I [Parcubacteria group bacterium]
MKTLILIDANALIHRAFYALPPMTGRDGSPTNALYGLSSILLKITREMQPDYIVAAFDLPVPTFRHKEFEAYKAQRKKASPELVAQLKSAPKVFEAFGIRTLSQEGYEADDVLASLVEQFGGEAGLKVIIITGDLDTLQLVKGDKVTVSTMKKGIGEIVVYDEKEVRARFGLSPDQLPDYKGLKGDPSDNIPGVPGIGDKTAIKLLQEFHDLENLYEAIEKDKTAVELKTYTKLIENKDQAFFSKYLAVVRRDLELGVTLLDLTFSFDEEKLRSFFEGYHFRSLVARLMNNEEVSQNREEEKHTASSVEVEIKCETLWATSQKEVFFFLEDDGLRVVGKEGYCVPDELQLKLIGQACEKSAEIIGHNNKEIIKWYTRHNDLLPHIGFDTMIAAWLLDPERRDYGLEGVMERALKKEFEMKSLFALYEWQQQKLKHYELDQVFYTIEMPLIPILAEMETRGIRLDKDRLVELREKVDGEIRDLEQNIFKVSESSFNISSPKQLSEVLFTLLKLPTKGIRKTPGGALSTDASELTKIKDTHPVINLVLRYRELTKLKTTYIDALPKLVDGATGRLHTTFNQTGTGTGRLSSSEPNLQNIPAQGEEAHLLRSAFVPIPGYTFLACDYSQLELRIVAALSEDKKMMEAFLGGKDIHAITAAEVNHIALHEVTPELRRHAKTLNFGMVYGMGVRAFAESSGLTPTEAKRFIKEYFENFEGIKKYQDSIILFAKKHGYVKTETGRRRYLPDITSGNPKFQSQAQRAAINMPTQGLAADIMKLAMIKAAQWIKENGYEDSVRLLLSIHDEMVFEVKDDMIQKVAPEIKRIMENAFTLSVPVIVDVKTGKNWGDMKRL